MKTIKQTIKQTIYILSYGVLLGMIPVSLNYIDDKFGVPKDISISVFIALILLSSVITKWHKLPKENLIGLGIFIGCSVGYATIAAIDHYVVNFFEPNIYWMAAAYLPLILFAIIVAKKDAQNS